MYLQEITRKALLQALKAMFCEDVNSPLVLGLLCKWMKSTFRMWCAGVEMQLEQQTDDVVSSRRVFSISDVTCFPLSSDSPNHLLREVSLSPMSIYKVLVTHHTQVDYCPCYIHLCGLLLCGLCPCYKSNATKTMPCFFSTLCPIPNAELPVSMQKRFTIS